MKKWLALLVLALALGLVVAACGDDDEEENGGGAAQTQQDTGGGTDTNVGTQGTGEGGRGGGTVEISIGDNFFEPREASVSAGSTVMWKNEGQVPHTVTKSGGSGKQFDSGQIEPGGDFSTKVSRPGTIEYVCTIHAGQMGSLNVE
jgi:plastocyanin